jgi:carbon storage regulator CsrA
MLMLGRRVNEAVLVNIGGTVARIVVCECRDGKVRLGFEADQSVRIIREELATKGGDGNGSGTGGNE